MGLNFTFYHFSKQKHSGYEERYKDLNIPKDSSEYYKFKAMLIHCDCLKKIGNNFRGNLYLNLYYGDFY